MKSSENSCHSHSSKMKTKGDVICIAMATTHDTKGQASGRVNRSMCAEAAFKNLKKKEIGRLRKGYILPHVQKK